MRVEVKDPMQYGEWLRFRVEIRDDAGALEAEITGNGVRGGLLYGPCSFSKARRSVPIVIYHAGGLKAAILDAIARTTWATDFPNVKLPAAGGAA